MVCSTMYVQNQDQRLFVRRDICVQEKPPPIPSPTLALAYTHREVKQGDSPVVGQACHLLHQLGQHLVVRMLMMVVGTVSVFLFTMMIAMMVMMSMMVTKVVVVMMIVW